MTRWSLLFVYFLAETGWGFKFSSFRLDSVFINLVCNFLECPLGSKWLVCSLASFLLRFLPVKLKRKRKMARNHVRIGTAKRVCIDNSKQCLTTITAVSAVDQFVLVVVVLVVLIVYMAGGHFEFYSKRKLSTTWQIIGKQITCVCDDNAGCWNHGRIRYPRRFVKSQRNSFLFPLLSTTSSSPLETVPRTCCTAHSCAARRSKFTYSRAAVSPAVLPTQRRRRYRHGPPGSFVFK